MGSARLRDLDGAHAALLLPLLTQAGREPWRREQPAELTPLQADRPASAGVRTHPTAWCSYTVIVARRAGCGRSARRWYHAARVSETAIPFLARRRERALVAQKVPHVLGALVLFGDGVLRAQHETQTYGWVLSGAEVLASALVLGAFVYALVASAKAQPGDARPTPSGIDWVDLLLAGMFAVEAVVHHDETNHWPRPTVLLAATMFVLAILH